MRHSVPMMVIATRLRTARLAIGLTQQQLAGTRFSKGYISAIERGRMMPAPEALFFLADRLGIPLAYLLGELEIDLEMLKKRVSELGVPSNQRTEEAIKRVLAEAEAALREGKPDKALELLGGCQEVPNDLSLVQRLDWYWLAGWTLILVEKPEDAFHFLKEGIRLAESLQSLLPGSRQAALADVIERLRYYLGSALCALGRPQEALECHLQGQAAIMAKRVTDPELNLLIYTGLGRDSLVLGRFKDAINFYGKAIQEAEDQHNPRQRGLAFWGMGVAYQEMNELEDAKRSYLQAVEALGEYKDLRLLAQIRNLLGLVLANLHEYKRAEDQFRLSLELVRSLGDTLTWGYILGNLAGMYLTQGNINEAIEAANVGLLTVEQSGDNRNKGQLHLTLASAYEARGDMASADQAFKRAIGIFEHITNHDLLGQGCERYASFLKNQGRFQEAFEYIFRAYTIFK